MGLWCKHTYYLFLRPLLPLAAFLMVVVRHTLNKQTNKCAFVIPLLVLKHTSLPECRVPMPLAVSRVRLNEFLDGRRHVQPEEAQDLLRHLVDVVAEVLEADDSTRGYVPLVRCQWAMKILPSSLLTEFFRDIPP